MAGWLAELPVARPEVQRRGDPVPETCQNHDFGRCPEKGLRMVPNLVLRHFLGPGSSSYICEGGVAAKNHAFPYETTAKVAPRISQESLDANFPLIKPLQKWNLGFCRKALMATFP